MSNHDYPRGKLQTKLGEVEFSWTQADHAYVGTHNGAFLTVRGVKYHCSTHIYFIDGKWQRKEPIYRDPYVSRSIHDARKDGDISVSARQALADAMLEAWIVYADSHANQGVIAERCKVGQEVDRLAEEIATLEETLKGKKTEHKQKSKLLTALGGPVD